MKIINKQLLDEICQEALQSSRLRMNHNFHEHLDDLINRLINAMQPNTYLRPHRHQNPDKQEIFLLLRGSAMLFIFDNDGNVTQKLRLDPKTEDYGAEIAPGVWHTLFVIEPDTVVYEIKQGPFAPLAAENFAPWSPPVEDETEVAVYLKKLEELIK